jgi:SRSO17 transposase
LQWFLTESTWDHQQVNEQRVQLLCQDLATAPHEQGVLVIDDTGDRKDGTATTHVARQYLGSVGKIDNGIVAVTSLWAEERGCWPVQVVPYTPASRLAKGKRDLGVRTKPQLAVELVEAAQQAGIGFRAVVADCAYGDNPGFTQALGAAKVPFVLALKPRKGTWAPADAAHTPTEAAAELGWQGPRNPGQMAAYPAALPRRPYRELVGGRRDLLRRGSGPAAAAGGGHPRPGQPARAQQLIPAHQPPPTGRPPRPAGHPG